MGLVWKIQVIDLVRFWCRDERPKTAIRDNGPLQGRILSRRQGRAGEGGKRSAPPEALRCRVSKPNIGSIPMAVSPPPAPSSIDLSGLPPRVVEAAARVLALCREELRSEPRPEAPEEVESAGA